MIRKFAIQYNMCGEVTKIEDKYLKAGEALQELVNEIMNGLVRVEQIRFTDETVVIHLGGKSPIQQRHAYFVGDYNDMVPYAKFATYIAQRCFRATDGKPYSYLTFGKQIPDVERDAIRIMYGEEYAVWYYDTEPSIVLLRAFQNLSNFRGWSKSSIEALKLETAASAFALVLDGDATMSEALALAK